MALTVHKSQFHCSGVIRVHSRALRYIAFKSTPGNSSRLFYRWSSLRNNNLATNVQRFTSSYACRCLPHLTVERRHFGRQPHAGMGQFGAAVSAMDVSAIAVSAMDISAMKCEMCFLLECHQSAKVRHAVVWEACKRKSQSSTCPRSFQLCCIYCDS